jgi:NAD(P)-dependent dehydrogenase (short-subunit alcohol dehydrogenase family)
LIACGKTRTLALASADIAEQTLRTQRLATTLGQYVPISEDHVFAMEFWALQRKKITVHTAPLDGQVALVTGAGGIIGYGIADKLLQAGACVVLADIDAKKLATVKTILMGSHDPNKLFTVAMDVTSMESVQAAYRELCLHFGGIDIVVPNAGIAHVAPLETLDTEAFRKTIDVNQIGTFHVIKGAIPYFKAQNAGGNIVCISSKNVFAPGASFGAYSASKAGAHQLARIASLELAPIKVRVNMINPDGVFGTDKVASGLWDLVGPDRMKARNLDPEGLKDYYRNRNLLKVSVTAEHVGNAVVFFSSNLTPTTGASLPVDGGVPEAAPR